MTCLPTYDLSTLYITVPHVLVNDKSIDLTERTPKRVGSPYLICSDRNEFLYLGTNFEKYHA